MDLPVERIGSLRLLEISRSPAPLPSPQETFLYPDPAAVERQEVLMAGQDRLEILAQPSQPLKSRPSLPPRANTSAERNVGGSFEQHRGGTSGPIITTVLAEMPDIAPLSGSSGSLPPIVQIPVQSSERYYGETLPLGETMGKETVKGRAARLWSAEERRQCDRLLYTFDVLAPIRGEHAERCVKRVC